MKCIHQLAVSGILLLQAACQNPGSSSNPGGDGDLSGGGQDQGSGVDQKIGTFTIRELNESQVAIGTRVSVQGVVMSPEPWPYVIDGGTGCLYQIVVVQADINPTLHDGLVVQRTTHPGPTGLDLAACRTLGANLDVAKAAPGSGVTLTGGYRGKAMHLLDLDGGELLDGGAAAQQPIPVTAQPKDFPSLGFSMPAPAAFFAARGALLRFGAVTTSNPNTASNTFQVAQAVSDLTTISGRYLRVLDPTYMVPLGGTALTSLTGIVSTDLGGSVWPRQSADVTK